VSAAGLHRRADGKLYPAVPWTREQRNRARWLAHNLVHRDGMTIRRAQQVMAEGYGVRRSLGIISRDLERFECPACRDGPAGTPQASPPLPAGPARAPWPPLEGSVLAGPPP
jgi:hypothetical protein